MGYAVAYLVAGLSLIGLGRLLGGAWWVCVWPAESLLLVSVGYLWAGPRVFGKRPDGRLAWWSPAALGPFLLAARLSWIVRRRFGGVCCARVAPGLWVGRRPRASEVPAGVGTIVDLTAEHPEARAVTRGRRYLCLPTLDGATPERAALEGLLAALADAPGEMLIHCALGRGRSAVVAAALLVRRGLASDAASAVAALRRARPNVFLNRRQRRFLRALLGEAEK